MDSLAQVEFVIVLWASVVQPVILIWTIATHCLASMVQHAWKAMQQTSRVSVRLDTVESFVNRLSLYVLLNYVTMVATALQYQEVGYFATAHLDFQVEFVKLILKSVPHRHAVMVEHVWKELESTSHAAVSMAS